MGGNGIAAYKEGKGKKKKKRRVGRERQRKRNEGKEDRKAIYRRYTPTP